MPFEPAGNRGGSAPKQPHLGVVIDASGELLAIPPGAIVYFIEDPSNNAKIMPVALRKVSLKKLSFECQCHDPNCSRVLEYSLTRATGHHYTEEQRLKARDKKRSR